MGPQFTRVLLNGAPMASASAGSWGGNISANREVDMDFLPSELFSSASVYKSQKASIIEGGIAGTVNMRSARPFDKAGFRSAFTLSGNYRDQNKQVGYDGLRTRQQHLGYQGIRRRRRAGQRGLW